MATRRPRRARSDYDWPAILALSVEIVHRYTTRVTLRQLFYQLVSASVLPNTQNAYKALSKVTAMARRAGAFPALMDRERSIFRVRSFTSPTAARGWLHRIYRRDRTEGQAFAIYLGVEKRGIVEQLDEWYGDRGLPILALRGYSSQTYEQDVIDDVEADARPAVLLYAGDFDPSGEDIDRNFIEQTACWSDVRRVALSAAQVAAYDLPPQPGKAQDSRAAGFVKRHGRLVQVELDALPPDTLRALYDEALADYWDDTPYLAALDRERADRRELDPGDTDEDDE